MSIFFLSPYINKLPEGVSKIIPLNLFHYRPGMALRTPEG
jgi:hypothetical protein